MATPISLWYLYQKLALISFLAKKEAPDFITGAELGSNLPKALLPKEMGEALNSYFDQFKEAYPERCLFVLPHMGSGEVSYKTRGGQTYILLVSTPQLVILNLFNGKRASVSFLNPLDFDTLSFAEIQTTSLLPVPIIFVALKTLLRKPPSCSGPLLFSTDKGE